MVWAILLLLVRLTGARLLRIQSVCSRERRGHCGQEVLQFPGACCTAQGLLAGEAVACLFQVAQDLLPSVV